MTIALRADQDSTPSSSGVDDASFATSTSLQSRIATACDKIAPLWPLSNFVAVNPFLGFTHQSFAATCADLQRVASIRMLMPRAFYRQALADGAIDDRDLEAALASAHTRSDTRMDVATLRLAVTHDALATAQPRRVVATVADVLDALAAGDRQASRTAFMVDEISGWCAAYFDEGQAAWKLPSRHLRPYPAWLNTMRHDRNPESMGIKGFRKAISTLPTDPSESIGVVMKHLGIPDSALDDYLHRALLDITGWAGYARYLGWTNSLQGRADDTLIHLLAIRLAWGYALFCERKDAAFRAAWRDAMSAASTLPKDSEVTEDPDLAIDLLMQEAYETAFQRRFLARLADASRIPQPAAVSKRKPLQAAFCIDVRSEVYRRSLETVYPEAETLGFAGFFGVSMEYVPLGQVTGGARCPVLLTPAVVVCEAVSGVSDEDETRMLRPRLLRRRVAKAWKAFKLSAVSSFTYVETSGLLFAAKILGDSAGITRSVKDPIIDGLASEVVERIGPRLAPRPVNGRLTGVDAQQRVAMAEALLRGMSMTADFARLVLLVGHGSTSANNPHSSSLDCGACGGHSGEPNARVAAAILNDPEVRHALQARGIRIPPDTWFLAALHDTTTDDIELYDLAALPASHLQDLQRLKSALKNTSGLARAERSALLALDKPTRVDQQVIARSRDWSQIRPEWGLAGNAAFIAAPRERTRGIDLQGRAFLHNYDWHQDAQFAVLELIMTAPLVVASWINLQYYGSTVNNRAFGSGNKTLHNVVAQVGVLEGNAGDLRVGLPWQSVHDGKRFIHEPLRLNAFIEAPQAAINRVIDKHTNVRDLVDNRWIHLFAIQEGGQTIRRYRGQGQWEATG